MKEENEEPDWVRYLNLAVKYVSLKENERQRLIDDFAKAAMQGLISNTNNISYIPGNSDRGLVLDGISKDAYDIASAMMQERERRMKG